MEKMILFGCGQMLARNIDWLKKRYEIICLSDNDPAKWGRTYYGIECVAPEKLSEYLNIKVKVVIENQAVEAVVKKQLNDMGMVAVEELYKMDCEVARIDTDGWKIPEKIYLFGTLQECRFLDKVISHCLKDVLVEGYATCSIKEIGTDPCSNRKVVSMYRALKELKQNEHCGILASARGKGFSAVTKRVATRDALNSGRYYIVPNETFCTDIFTKEIVKKIFTPYNNCYRIGSVQFLVTRNCNLNCKLCSHFAPLVNEKRDYDFQMFQKDAKRVAEIFDAIDEIGLWGGEALLAEHLEKFIRYAREIFPNSRIVVGTNGLLLGKLKDEIIAAMKETNAMFAISLYPPTLEQIEEIKEKLDRNGIAARYPGGIKIDRFFRRYDLTGENDIEKRYDECESKYCTTVFEGKLAACYFPICAADFNYAFGESFHVQEDIIDLYDETVERDVILRKVREPFRACRYCGESRWEDWSVIGKESKKEDWVLRI